MEAKFTTHTIDEDFFWRCHEIIIDSHQSYEKPSYDHSSNLRFLICHPFLNFRIRVLTQRFYTHLFSVDYLQLEWKFQIANMLTLGNDFH